MDPGPEQSRASGVGADCNFWGCVRRGHDGGKERQEQGEVGRDDKEDRSQGERGEGEAETAD